MFAIYELEINRIIEYPRLHTIRGDSNIRKISFEILELVNYKKDGGEDWAIVQRYVDKGSYYEKSRKEAMPPEIWDNVTPTKWIEKPVRYN